MSSRRRCQKGIPKGDVISTRFMQHCEISNLFACEFHSAQFCWHEFLMEIELLVMYLYHVCRNVKSTNLNKNWILGEIEIEIVNRLNVRKHSLDPIVQSDKTKPLVSFRKTIFNGARDAL